MRHEQLFSPMKVPSALAEGQSSLHQRRARPGPYFVRLLRQCRTERPPMANRTGRKRQLADSRAGFSCPLPGAELCRRRERQRGGQPTAAPSAVHLVQKAARGPGARAESRLSHGGRALPLTASGAQ